MPYQNYNMQYVAPQSLEYLDKTLSGLQQKHENTIERASALKATIASLDLNEAEAEYRDGLIQGIDAALNSKDVDGFKGYAFDDVIKMSGDLASDKSLLGRLNAQKQYKEFTEAVDKSNEFGQDVKDWSKANNQYYYDEASGGKWNPTVTPTKQIDLNTVAQMAMKYIVPQTGNINQVRYYDASGNVTTTFDPKGTIDVFDVTSGAWERVTEQQVRDGLAAVIQQSPEVRASLEQDYEVAKWKDNKNKGTDEYVPNPMLYNNDGTTKSLNEYTEDIFAPFIRSQIRYTSDIKTTPNTNLLKSIQKYNENKGAGDINNNEFNNLIETKGMPGIKHEYKNTEIQDAQSRMDNNNAEFRKYISSMPEFKNLNIDYGKIDYTKPDETENYLREVQKNNSNLTNETINYLMSNIWDEYINSYSDIEDINNLKQKDPKAASKALLYAKISNGADLNIDNVDINKGDLVEYGYLLDKIYTKGNFIGVFQNNKEYSNAIEELKNRGYGNLIKKGQLSDGRYYIGLDKENRRLTIPVIESINNNTNKLLVGYYDGNGHVLNDFNPITNPDDKWYTKVGKYIGNTFSLNPKGMIHTVDPLSKIIEPNYVDHYVNEFLGFYNKLNKDSKIAEQSIVEETSVIDGATPQAALALSMAGDINTPSSEANRYYKLADEDKNLTMRNISSADISELGMLVLEDNKWIQPKSKDEKDIWNKIRYNQEEYDVSMSLVSAADSGRMFTQVNFRKKGSANSKDGFSVLFTSNQMRRYNPALAAAEDNPDFQMTSLLNRRKRVGKSTLIGFEKDNNGVFKYYTLKPTGGDTFDLVSGNDVLARNINNVVAKELLAVFNSIRNKQAYLKTTSVSDEEKNEYINKASNQLQLLCNYYGINIFDKSYEEAVKDMIL